MRHFLCVESTQKKESKNQFLYFETGVLRTCHNLFKIAIFCGWHTNEDAADFERNNLKNIFWVKVNQFVNLSYDESNIVPFCQSTEKTVRT